MSLCVLAYIHMYIYIYIYMFSRQIMLTSVSVGCCLMVASHLQNAVSVMFYIGKVTLATFYIAHSDEIVSPGL